MKSLSAWISMFVNLKNTGLKIPKLTICEQIEKMKSQSAWISMFVDLKNAGFSTTLKSGKIFFVMCRQVIKAHIKVGYCTSVLVYTQAWMRYSDLLRVVQCSR